MLELYRNMAQIGPVSSVILKGKILAILSMSSMSLLVLVWREDADSYFKADCMLDRVEELYYFDCAIPALV